MNRASIPGFYFDDVKGKYFKIQASHLVPQGAKYSRGNIKQENRKAKKRKTEDQKQIKLHQHSVKRNPVLQNAITGGTGLSREHGTATESSNLDRQDAAIISQFRPTTVTVRLPGYQTCPQLHLTSAMYLPATEQMVTASSHAHTGVSTLHVCNWDWEEPKFEMPHGCGFAAFHSSITSISLATSVDGPHLVACSRQDASTGQIFASPIPPPGAEPIYPYQPPGIYFHVRNDGDNRLVTSINPTTGVTAVSTAKSVYILNNDATMSNSLSHDNEEYRIAIDWLDTNTVAFEANSPDSSNHHIKLWDVRTAKGVVSRFKVRNRISGILNPSRASYNSSKDGRQLLASTNLRINLYDTRMPHTFHKDDLPVLSFPHIHQGPELDFTTDGRNLIAAVDRDNVVQVFSVRSGRWVDSLSAPRPEPYTPQIFMVKKLQWYDDPKVGSALQACVGSQVVRWSWGGGMDDEDG